MFLVYTFIIFVHHIIIRSKEKYQSNFFFDYFILGAVWIDFHAQTCRNIHLKSELNSILDLPIINNGTSSSSNSSSNSSSSSSSSQQYQHLLLHPISILVPCVCLTPLDPDEEPPLPLTSFDIGKRVSLASFPLLKSSFDRFDWFDRPSLELLKEIAGIYTHLYNL